MEVFLSEFGKSFSTSEDAWVFMYAIALFAALALAIFIERFYYIMIRSNINDDKFMAEIRKLVAGGNMDRAIALCDKGKQKALPFVVLRGLKRAIESEALDFRAIQNAVDEGTLEVIPKLQERTNYLSMFANVATLTGLMGTIFGLIIAFAMEFPDREILLYFFIRIKAKYFAVLVGALELLALFLMPAAPIARFATWAVW